MSKLMTMTVMTKMIINDNDHGNDNDCDNDKDHDNDYDNDNDQ